MTSPGNPTERVIYAELNLNTPNRPIPRVPDDTNRVYANIAKVCSILNGLLHCCNDNYGVCIPNVYL